MASTLGTIAIAPIWTAAMRSAVSIMQICAVHGAFSNQQNSIFAPKLRALHKFDPPIPFDRPQRTMLVVSLCWFTQSIGSDNLE